MRERELEYWILLYGCYSIEQEMEADIKDYEECKVEREIDN